MLLELTDLLVGYPGFQAGPLDAGLNSGLVHLAGPNGSGKTTLLRCLCGEIPPVSGRVRIDGKNPLADHRARRHASLVPAAAEIPAFLTVSDAWRISAAMRGQPEWNGQPWADQLKLPEKLVLAHASTGQRQRTELLCAMAGDPSILMLDETLVHIDAEGVDLVTGWAREWSRNRVVLISHHGELPIEPDAIWQFNAAAPCPDSGARRSSIFQKARS